MFEDLFSLNTLLSIPALIVALTVHEYAHAVVATQLGDPTPRYSGRLTLNPAAHIDPIGLIMLLLFRFGWAKPVPINTRHFKDGRKGVFMVSMAGPASNLFVALLSGIFIALLIKFGLMIRGGYLEAVLNMMVIYNLGFAIFNMIPIPPLDGGKVLMSILPGRQAYALQQIENYGALPLIIVAMVIGSVIITPLVRVGISIISMIIHFIILI